MSQGQNMDGQSVYAKQVDKLKAEVGMLQADMACSGS